MRRCITSKEPKEPVTFATILLVFGETVSVIGGLFIFLIEELYSNGDCNPCGYYLSLWIFYPLILGLGMIAIGLIWRQRLRVKS